MGKLPRRYRNSGQGHYKVIECAGKVTTRSYEPGGDHFYDLVVTWPAILMTKSGKEMAGKAATIPINIAGKVITRSYNWQTRSLQGHMDLVGTLPANCTTL